MCISLIQYNPHQVKPHSSPWFSAAWGAAIVHRNPFFHLYQQNISFESKAKFRLASNHCKSVLEAAKLAYATKIRNLALMIFFQIPNIFNKSKSAIPPLFIGLEVLSSASNKTFLRTLILMSIHLPVFPSRTNLKLHNISVTSKMVKRS